MDLLIFYIDSIFYFLEFPTASEICTDDGGIIHMCKSTINFVSFYPICLLIISVGLASKSFGSALKFFCFGLLSSIISFYFADRILSKITSPASYHIEDFFFSFYIWSFLITNLLIASCLYFEKFRKFIFIGLVLTIVSIILFSIYGRGTFEQFLVIKGVEAETYGFKELFSSELVKLVAFYFCFCLIYALLSLTAKWIKDAEIVPYLFFRNFISFAVFSAFALTNDFMQSLPFHGLLQ